MAELIAYLILGTAVLGMLATYLLYPIYQLWFPGKESAYPSHGILPKISVIFAAYNEESIIREKLESILSCDYPNELLEILVGSDQSSDRTDAIVQELAKNWPNIILYRTSERSGKSAIMNTLAERSTGEILVATDANIIFQKDTLNQLVLPFAEPSVGAVAGALMYEGDMSNSTSRTEGSYLSIENRIRKAESNKYGFCLGMEGGLYAIRKKSWSPIPPNTFMEDFFQTMNLILDEQQIVFNEKAIGLEDVSTSIQEEYKRKIRISIGNFQNLKRFRSVVFRPWKTIGWSFLLHKVLRWITPVLALTACAASVFTPTWPLILTLFLFIPISQILWVKVFPPNALAYFCIMNLGLLVGLLKYSQGVRSSVWQPTKRKQYES